LKEILKVLVSGFLAIAKTGYSFYPLSQKTKKAEVLFFAGYAVFIFLETPPFPLLLH